MKKRLLALVLAAVMGLMTACGGGTSSTAAPAASGGDGSSAGTAAPAGDTSAILGQTSEVSNLNPLVQPRAVDSNATCMIFGCLVIPDEEINYVGDLAEKMCIRDSCCPAGPGGTWRRWPTWTARRPGCWNKRRPCAKQRR